MPMAGDGKIPYESGGTGGKFRKKPFRRNIPTKPYNRPPTALRINSNNNPSLLTKIVDPASRLIYAGAHKLFGIFRKGLLSSPLQGSPEVNEEPQNMPQEAVHSGNSAATGISELEHLLQQKTFSRSEIQRLTALLHSRTTELPSDGVERDGAKPFSSPSSLLRLKASTSASLKRYGDERDNPHDDISTPIISSKVFEETVTPAELAKSYMGSRPSMVAPAAPRQDSMLYNNATGLSKTPITSMASKTANTFRGLENGFVTPRSRGRSAMYSMARTSYARSPPTSTQKGIVANYGHDEALTSYSAFGHERTVALKRRSSVLDDDLGAGGSLRRTRQKANLVSQRYKRELGYTANQQPDSSSQKLLLMNGSEAKVSQGVEENGDMSVRGSASGSGYASVPTKSTQTSTKILQLVEKPTPKERSSGSTKSPTKLTLDMLHGQALRSLEKLESPKLLPYPHDRQKSEVQPYHRLDDSQQLTTIGKEKVDENGSRKFPIPHNMLTSVNGDSPVTLKDNAPIVRITDSPSKLPAEPPLKKRAFQMSAPEDSFEMDDEVYANGHVFSPLVDQNKLETSLVANKSAAAVIIESPTLHEGSKSPALVENNKPVFSEVANSPALVESYKPVVPEVAKIPEPAELKEAGNTKSSPKTDAGFLGGSVSEPGIGFRMSTSPSLTTITQTSLLPELSFQKETVVSGRDSSSFPFGTIAENSSPFLFSVNAPAEFKPNSNSDPKALDSTSVFTSVTKNDHVKDLMSKKDQNGYDQKSASIFGNSGSSPSAFPASTSTSGSFLFSTSTENSKTPNATPASSPPTFPSFAPFPPSNVSTNSLFNSSSPIVTSSSTPTVISTNTTSTTTATSSILSSSVPSPVFGFGSITLPSTTSGAETANTNTTNKNMPNSIMTSSPFPTTSLATATTTTGSSLFRFGSPAPASTTNNQSQGSFFNVTNGSQSNTQTSTPVTQAVSFQFGSRSTGIPSSTSGTSLFGSSAPAFSSSSSFGVSSVAASSEGKSVSGSMNSIFGSNWQVPQSSGFGSTFSSSASSPLFSFGASSTPMPSAATSPVIFASTGASAGFFTTVGATNSSFTTPSQGQPIFGSSAPIFGAAATSPHNNDQMSMEDSMAEDSMQTPSPVSPFGQSPAAAPGFMFGSATPTPTQPVVPYQFGGQANQAPPQNPFQSSSAEFNAGGGSFSLGSGGDKSGRRIVRVKKQNRRK